MKVKEKQIKVTAKKSFLYKNNRMIRRATQSLVDEKDVKDLEKFGLINQIKSKEGYTTKVVEPKTVYDIKNIAEVTKKEVAAAVEPEIKKVDEFYVIPDGRKYRSIKQAEKALAKTKKDK